MKYSIISIAFIILLFILPSSINAYIRNNIEETPTILYKNNNVKDTVSNRDPIEMIGFEKRINDKTESFLLRNNTCNLITRIRLKIYYKTPKNEMIDYREVTIDQEIHPHMTKQIEINSFDKNKRYYDIFSPNKNNEGYPFKISWVLLRYDIAIIPQ